MIADMRGSREGRQVLTKTVGMELCGCSNNGFTVLYKGQNDDWFQVKLVIFFSFDTTCTKFQYLMNECILRKVKKKR